MFGSRKNGQSWIRDRRSGSMEGERDAARRGVVWCGGARGRWLGLVMETRDSRVATPALMSRGRKSSAARWYNGLEHASKAVSTRARRQTRPGGWMVCLAEVQEGCFATPGGSGLGTGVRTDAHTSGRFVETGEQFQACCPRRRGVMGRCGAVRCVAVRCGSGRWIGNCGSWQ